MKVNFLFIFFLVALAPVFAQHSSSAYRSNLSRNVSLNISRQKLEEVLDKISKQGGFTFSYSGTILQRDSIISISVQNQPIREVLDQLFQQQVDYKENGDYIILRPTARRFSVVPENIATRKNRYEIDGHVYDERTGGPVKDASVYEKKLLRSTLTDEKGYFSLKLKTAQQSAILTVSKENFRDTSIQFLSVITVIAQGYTDENSGSGPSNLVERFGFGRFLTSSRQRLQSLNIPDFIANSPFQASLLPGISSHGILSSQIVNKGSLNIWGGYTAGVDGVEIGGIFNVNKKDVKKLQIAGTLNVVGGSVIGVQVSGVANVVLDSVNGVQAAGVFNTVKNDVTGVQASGVINVARGKLKGVQAAGVINQVAEDVKGTQVAGVINSGWNSVDGAQVAGVLNFTRKSVRGAQAAGVGNITGNTIQGSQVAGVFNYARRMYGTQIGLINVADTSSGYSIGLLNLVRKGYHKISISANEVTNANLSIKTGNAKLYTMLMGGINISDSAKVYSFGLGWGHDFIFNKRVSLAAELTNQFLYLGKPVNSHILTKVQTHMQISLVKGITLFAGPSYSVYFSDHMGMAQQGYKAEIAPGYSTSYFRNVKGWLGGNVGLTLM